MTGSGPLQQRLRSWPEASDTGLEGSMLRQRETKQNHLSPASKHAMSDKGRQGETKQSDPSPASMGDKVISAQHPDADKGGQGETKGDKAKSQQHPDMPWETRGGKAKSSQPSVQTCHGREGETKGGNHLGPASFLCKN